MTTAYLLALLVLPFEGDVQNASLTDAPAVTLHYRGELSPLSRDGADDAVKTFELYTLVRPTEAGTLDVVHLVDEEGSGGWHWPERFGRVALNQDNQPAQESARPQLLFEFEKTNYPVELPFPVFGHFDELEEDAAWRSGRNNYEVTGQRKIGDRETWQVDVSDNRGHRRRLWIDQNQPIVVAAESRVFVGQGDLHLLKMSLDSQVALSEEDRNRLNAPIDTLITLQSELNRPAGTTSAELTEAQLKQTQAVIEKLETETKETPFRDLYVAISKDVGSQNRRVANLKSLVAKFVGQPAPQFSLKDLQGETVEWKDGKIVVLHIWDYRGKPLTEPYGQVGYLDYLNSRRNRLGVNVYGVAVDSRFGDPMQFTAARREVRSFREFMNVRYTVTTDDGAILRAFGDPQKLGATLPLWVVIGADGNVVHYKAGFYSIKPNEGLKELDDVVVEEIRKQRAASD